MKSLFVVNVRLPDEYKAWVNEIVKTVVLLTTIHVLQYLTKNTGRGSTGLFNAGFWKLMVFAIIGFSAYYLVVRKLVRFRYVGDHEVLNDGQSPHSVAFSPFGAITRFRQWLKSKL